VEVHLDAFFTSRLYGDDKPASCPSRLFPVKMDHGNHCIGDWVGCRADVNLVEKSLTPAGNRTLRVCLYVNKIHSSVGIVTGLGGWTFGKSGFELRSGKQSY
jgi:hypothetical protein